MRVISTSGFLLGIIATKGLPFAINGYHGSPLAAIFTPTDALETRRGAALAPPVHAVLAGCYQSEIPSAIVERVAVDMVNLTALWYRLSCHALHYNIVHSDRDTLTRNAWVTPSIYAPVVIGMYAPFPLIQVFNIFI
jgi:hypothetical protein